MNILAENTYLGRLEMRDTFIFYDIPLLFTCENENGQWYFAVAEDGDLPEITWLYVPIEVTLANKIREGAVSFREAFKSCTDGLAYNVTTRLYSEDSLQSVDIHKVPEDWFPTEGLRNRVKAEPASVSVGMGSAHTYSLLTIENSSQIVSYATSGIITMETYPGVISLGPPAITTVSTIEPGYCVVDQGGFPRRDALWAADRIEGSIILTLSLSEPNAPSVASLLKGNFDTKYDDAYSGGVELSLAA